MITEPSNREVEIKLRIAGSDEGRNLLERSGFQVREPRTFEANVLFDTPDEQLRRQGKLLRVRKAGGRIVLTYKGPTEPGRHKVREELELALSEAGSFSTILDRLGMAPLFRYEKYRTEYQRAGEPGTATLDETPIGVFLELEGDPDWIDRTAAELGFCESDYILSSYGRLYIEARSEDASHPPHMVFDKTGS